MATLSSWQQWWIHSWLHRLEIAWHVPAFLKSCPEPFRGEVLEVGAGQGWTSERILETFPQVELTATDVNTSSTGQFEQLRAVYGDRLRTLPANVLELPFDRDGFDIVIAINVLHILPGSQVLQALRQMLRVLRPGGLLGVCTCGRALAGVTSRQDIIRILCEEECAILSDKGATNYRVWAQKPYPVDKATS